MFNKLLKNASGKFSWMKVGGVLVSLAGIVITLPASGIALPLAVLTGAKVVGAIGAAIGISGARDALENK